MRTGLFVETLEVLLGQHAPVQDLLLEAGDGVVGAAHALDLLTATVGGTGVGHGVATVPVGDILEDQGTVAGDGVVLGVLDGGLGGQDVHTVDLDTGDVLTTLVVVGQGGGPGGGSTHTVFVVYFVSILLPLDRTVEETYSHNQTELGGSTAWPC